MSIKSATSKNVKWSFIESLSLKAIGFVLSIILARLLLPSDFGVLAIVNVFYLLTSIFIDGGLREALIQKNDADELDYSTVFWLNLGVSIVLYGVLFVLAPYIEAFYGYSQLTFLIRLQSLTLVIESFGIIQVVKATKDLDLKKITVARIPASLISFCVGIWMAYSGFGILSLIVQQLVSVLLYNLLLIYKIRYVPRFIFSKNSMKKLYDFGLKILGISFLSRFYVQSLNLIFAHFFTPQLLGLYTKSRNLQGVPVEIINSSYTKGIYPTMIRVQNHNRLLKKIFLSNIEQLSLIMIFVNGVIFFKSNEIVDIVLGNNWIDMAVYLKIIALGSLFQPLSNQVSSVLKVKGRPELLLKVESISKIFSLTIILVFSNFVEFYIVVGLFVFVNSIITIIYLYICSRILKFNFLKRLKRILLLFLTHFIVAYFLNLTTKLYFNDLLGVLFFVGFYFIISISLGKFFGFVNFKINNKND